MKTTKFLSLLLVAVISINNLFAVPIFGLPGQGTPSWTSKGIVKCNEGWKWCHITYYKVNDKLPDLRRLKDAIALDASQNGKLVITGSEEMMTRTFPKMFVKDELVITDNILLDDKISEELGKRLKLKSNGNLVLLKGKYKVTKKEGLIEISNVSADYVGHVTLLK